MGFNATGDWLLFLDADDTIAPGYLSAMTRAIERDRGDGPLLLTPAVRKVWENGKIGQRFFYPECSFETGNWLVIGTLVPRMFFMEVGGFRDFAHGLEDWNLWARCVRAGARIVKVPRAIYMVHWNTQSKHQKLARNRPEYGREYQAARVDAWG